MNAAPSKPDRTLIVIVSVIAALVIVALAVVFSRGEPKPLDASTPAGVVQRYTAAVISGDEAAAVDYLTPEVRAACGPYVNAFVDNVRVSLGSTTVRTSTADVSVLVVTTYDQGGPFGPSESEIEENFNLERVDGQWLISTTPWSLTVCSNREVR
ncbi:MAG: hypothetical protein ABIX44_06850 [Cryobacterium sp.]